MNDLKFELHKEVDCNINIVEFLVQETKLSKNKIKDCLLKGAVWLTNQQTTDRIRRAKKELVCGNTIHLYYDQKILDSVSPPPFLIKDETDYSIWFKPYGVFSQGSKWADHCTINRWVEKNLKPERPSFIVHRLDRAAIGLIILAHKKSVAALFSTMFVNREIRKKYHAKVKGEFPHNKLTIKNEIDGKVAISHVKIIAHNSSSNTTLLEIDIETGRKHQIRKHLSSTGFPIIGDRLYGNEETIHLSDLQLSSFFLRFNCPITGKLKEYVLPKGLALK